MLGSRVDEYDNQLLQTVQDVCNSLNLRMKARQLMWTNRVVVSKVNSDDCRFGLDVAYFPKSMRGKLDAKDWKPIIASSLNFRKILFKQFPLGLLPLIGGAFLILLIGGWIVGSFFATNQEAAFYLYAILAAGPFVVNRFTRIRRSQRFTADLETRKVVGEDSLVSVLRKIDDMELQDIKESENRGFGRYFSSKPSVAERIANLSR